MELSKYLREKRLAANLSQKDVSEKLGYSSAQFVSNWERNLSNPPVSTIFALAKIYGCSLTELKSIFLSSERERVTAYLEQQFKQWDQ